jgi:hypothetical protein
MVIYLQYMLYILIIIVRDLVYNAKKFEIPADLKPIIEIILVDNMAFVQAMNAPTVKLGVNGADVYTEEGVGDYRVSLFTMLNRGLSGEYIQEYVTKVFNGGKADEICDMFVMAFQTRDIRGGKGERKLFYEFMAALCKHDRELVKQVLVLIPEYGCWRDMWELLKYNLQIEDDVFEIVGKTFKADLESVTSNLDAKPKPKLSLLAKWLPREKSGIYPGLALKLANFIYADMPSERSRIVKYRKDVSMLNRVIKTVEINMCGKTWQEIKPETVPGRCLKIHTKAFLNERLKAKKGDEASLRYPDNEDRLQCRLNFQDFIHGLSTGEKKAHGANVVMPHELVVKALNSNTSKDELAINQGQWESIREETLKLGGLGKSLAMCDFSGSMSGLPKLISLALGILVSEISHESFKDHILTFDSDPKWHSFSGKKTLKEKLDSIDDDLGQGTSTNFFKACMCILDKMKEHRVPVGEEPEDLIVLTDMGFDGTKKSGSDKWSTQLELIRNKFKSASREVWGEEGCGWKVPRIVIWNLSDKYKDFHAKADQEGVVQLSGWSPSILTALQKGGVQVMTPYQGMRSVLDDERYDAVRLAHAASR